MYYTNKSFLLTIRGKAYHNFRNIHKINTIKHTESNLTSTKHFYTIYHLLKEKISDVKKQK